MTQLEQAIETIKDWERDIRFPNDDREAVRKDTLCEVLDYLTSLPSLPEGLDEAAKNYSLEKYGKTLLEPVEDFKAGAEWQAGQGYSQKTCVYFNRFNDETEAVIHLGRDGERGGFQPGDDVIVQIRRVNESK